MNGDRQPRGWTLAVAQWGVGRGSTVLFGGFMLGNAVAYAYQMLMSRTLSPGGYGVLVTLTSVFYVLSVFWRAAQAWVIEAVANKRGDSRGSPRAVLFASMRVLLPLGTVAFALHCIGSGWVANFLHLGARTPVVVLGLYVFSSFLMPVAVGLPMGLNRPRLASVILVLESSVRLIVGVALVILGMGVTGALVGFVAGNAVSFAVTLAALRSVLSLRRDPAPAVTPSRGYDPYALLVFAINVFLMTIASVDQVVVKHYFSEVEAGNYAVAFLLGRVISMSTMALSWVIFARSVSLPPDDPRRVRLFIKGLFATGAVALMFTGGYLIAPTAAVWALGGSHYGVAHRYVGLDGIEMTVFSLVYVQAYYLVSVRKTEVVWPLALASVLEILLLTRYHATMQQVLQILILLMVGLLVWVTGLSWWALRAARRQLAVPTRAEAVPNTG